MRFLLIGFLLVWGTEFSRGGAGDAGSPLAGWWVLYAEDTRGVDWHATVRIESGSVGGEDGVRGEFVWDTPSEFTARFFGRELFDGTFDAGTRGVTLDGFDLVEDQQLGTATYLATLTQDGQRLVDGSWDGPSVRPSDFFVAVKSGVVAESGFDADAQGWAGAVRWDAAEEALVSGGDGGSELVAPEGFHGDWSWRGRVPALLSFDVRWTGGGNATNGPVVTITGGGGTAIFEVTAGSAFEGVESRSYLVPLRGDLWEREGEVGWQKMLEGIDGLRIKPGTGTGGEFFVDNVQLVRPLKSEPALVEWGFDEGMLGSNPGDVGLDVVLANFVSGEVSPWWEPLVAREEVVNGEERSVLEIPERPSAANPFLDESPSLNLDRVPADGNGGGRRVNAYTFVWDLQLVGETLTDEQGRDQGSWQIEDFKKSSGITLLQSGAIDGGAVVVEYGRVKGVVLPLDLQGEVSEGEREIVRGQWYRVVLVVDASAGELAVYVDGVRVFDESELAEARRPSFDGRYSLGIPEVRGGLPSMFGSSGISGNELALAGLAFLDVALPVAQVAALGGVGGGGGVLTPVFDIGLEIDAVAMPGSMTLGFDGYPGWRYALERSEDLCLWQPVGELVGVAGERVQVEVRLDEKPAEYYRVRPVVD